MGAYKDLPSWAKGVVGVGVVVGIGVGFYYTIKIIKNLAQKVEQNQEEKVVKDDLKDLNKSSATKQSILDSQAKSFADGIFSALDGNGTDEQAIFSIFRKIKNDADVLAIIKAYGTRTLRIEILWEQDSFTGTLGGALREELDTQEMAQLNKILELKKIKFRF